jgi:hypothetical protein
MEGMSLSAFPILRPTDTGGKRPVMLYIFTYGGESHISCFRECTPQELDYLKADWPGYLARRAKWLEWARVNLKPTFQPGAWSHGRKMTPVDVKALLDFQA